VLENGISFAISIRTLRTPDTLFGFGEDAGFAVFAIEAETFELDFLVLIDVRPGFGTGFCQEATNAGLLQRGFANFKLFALPYGAIHIPRISAIASIIASQAQASILGFSQDIRYSLNLVCGIFHFNYLLSELPAFANYLSNATYVPKLVKKKDDRFHLLVHDFSVQLSYY
jgi:hypothetical protein